jgi:hypothetical protein
MLRFAGNALHGGKGPAPHSAGSEAPARLDSMC